jgi:glycerate dehydrogenase
MTQRIVVLDGYTLTTHVLGQTPEAFEPTWDRLAEFGDLTVYERTSPEQTVKRAKDAQIVLTNKVVLDQPKLKQLDGLNLISVLATGTNVVDLDAAKSAGITVSNVPAYSSASVAQHVFALLLELVSMPADHSRAVHAGRWASSDDFSFTLSPLTELSGLTMGVVGVGDIGKRVLKIADAMGMKLKAYSRTKKDLDLKIDWVELDELFASCDVISLHCPLTEATQGLVGGDRLASMKDTAILINTGRGPLIDESALAEALKNGTIGGAGLDVLSSEPPAGDNPLIGCPNCIITPHIAWATRAARQRMMDITVANVQAFVDGQPQNVVNG